jgi:ribose-phosphate pyrophosphokinase
MVNRMTKVYMRRLLGQDDARISFGVNVMAARSIFLQRASYFEQGVTMYWSVETMIVFSFADHERMLDTLHPAMQRGNCEIRRFANGELFISVRTPAQMEHCVVLGSVAPPDERLLSLALLSHTLKKDGSRKVTLFLPYLAYSRQDKEKPGESLATAWVGSILQASGVDEVLTIDVHSESDKHLFPISLVSIYPAEIFANTVMKYQLTDATIVAPDNGAIPRCKAVSEALGRSATGIPYFQKQRNETGIKRSDMFGSVGSRVLIIDDILDTGATLISACEKLLQTGATEIYIMVTHGLFTGPDWKKLWSLKVQRIFCTDTVPATKEILDERRITILPIGQLIKEHMALLRDIAVNR